MVKIKIAKQIVINIVGKYVYLFHPYMFDFALFAVSVACIVGHGRGSETLFGAMKV